MELPALKLPQIPLPFDIPVLLHPPVVHFVVAIPILVLIVEIINLIAKKRAIGVMTFFVLTLGMVATAAAYLTGTVDGKEAFDALSQAGQAELKAHKLLGTYLVIASAVLVVFKMLSALIRTGLLKAMYLLVLIVFTIGVIKQGKDGGELVYEYGANVERVADLDSELFDVKEELDEAKEAAQKALEKSAQVVEEVKESAAETVKEAAKKAEEVKEEVAPVTQAVEEKAQEAVETVKKNVEKVQEVVTEATDAVEAKPEAAAVSEAPAPTTAESTTAATDTVSEALPETTTTNE